MQVPFFKFASAGDELPQIKEVLDSGWLTTGVKTAEFERRFAEFVGAKYALAVNSCTSALHLAIEALGLQKNDRAFVPTMTFTATAEVLRYVGAHPVLLDVDYRTRNITPEILLEAIQRNPDVKTLMLVHFGGHPADLLGGDGPGILEICKNHNIRIVHDAAHAFPARIDRKMIGSFPDVTCFSFYANKTITTGEGGMLVTDSEDIYQRAKLMRLHGIDRDVWDRFTSRRPKWEYDVVAPGFKYNLPDIAAAIGLSQLARAEELRAQRQRCAELYIENLASLIEIDIPGSTLGSCHAWHLFTVNLNSLDQNRRDHIMQSLAEKGIGTSLHYKPLHRMTYYRKEYGLQSHSFPNAEKLWSRTFSLPLYPSLGDSQIAYVCQQLRRIVRDMHEKNAFAA